MTSPIGQDVQAPQVIPVDEVDPGVDAGRDAGGLAEVPDEEVLHMHLVGHMVLEGPGIVDVLGGFLLPDPDTVPAVGACPERSRGKGLGPVGEKISARFSLRGAASAGSAIGPVGGGRNGPAVLHRATGESAIRCTYLS